MNLIRPALVLLPLFVTSAVFADGGTSLRTYETVFGSQAREATFEDINVWVYTRAFAERFGMPERWIDDELKGAFALAYRVETPSGRLLFPHKGPDVSMVRHRCILDVYLPSEADLPWAENIPVRFKYYPPDSSAYLQPQRREDRRWKLRYVGIPVGTQARRPLIYIGRKGSPRKRAGTGTVDGYDRQLYAGVTKLSLDVGCLRKARTALWIEFLRDGPWRKGPEMERYVTHRIDIPLSFMKRVEARYGESEAEVDKRWQKFVPQ